MPLLISPHPSGLVIAAKVVPNSSRDQIAGLLGEALKIKVAVPPEAGRANKAVEALLAKALNLPPKNVTVIAGQTNPQKRILIQGATPEAIRALVTR